MLCNSIRHAQECKLQVQDSAAKQQPLEVQSCMEALTQARRLVEGRPGDKHTGEILGRTSKTNLIFIMCFLCFLGRFWDGFLIIIVWRFGGFHLSLLLGVFEPENWCVSLKRVGWDHGLSPGEGELRLHMSIKVAVNRWPGNIWQMLGHRMCC